MSSAAAYLIGLKETAFPDDDVPLENALISAERLDGRTLNARQFKHCTFANVSFKDVVLKDSKFDHCVFIECYFRRTQMANSSFVGAKFFGCLFPKPVIQSSNFRYALFERCAVSYDEMEHSLPREPNLREDLAACLARTSEDLGFTTQARKYRLAAVAARQEHLAAAVQGASQWYRQHYSGMRRFRAVTGWLGLRINGIVWGHGERWGILLRNLAVLTLVIFPALLWVFRGGLVNQDGAYPDLGEILWLSVTTIIPVDGIASTQAVQTAPQVVLAIEAFAGIVMAGLFVTLLVRWGLRR